MCSGADGSASPDRRPCLQGRRALQTRTHAPCVLFSFPQPFELTKLEKLHLLNYCPHTPLELFQVGWEERGGGLARAPMG